MTFPDAPSFLAGATGSLWWKVNYSEGVTVCSSQGRTVIQLAQRNCQTNVPADYYTVPGDSRRWLRADLEPDGIIGDDTLAGFVWMLGRLGAPATMLDGVRADFRAYTDPTIAGGRGLPLSQATCAAAIWLAMNGAPDLSAYEFPTFVPPLFNQGSADDGPAVVTCVPLRSIPIRPPATGGATRTGTTTTPPATTTTTTTTTTARKSNTGTVAVAAAAVLALIAAASRKRKR